VERTGTRGNDQHLSVVCASRVPGVKGTVVPTAVLPVDAPSSYSPPLLPPDSIELRVCCYPPVKRCLSLHSGGLGARGVCALGCGWAGRAGAVAFSVCSCRVRPGRGEIRGEIDMAAA